MKAININNPNGSIPAPKEWAEIKEIKHQRPKGIGQYVSLQKIDDTENVCVWMTSSIGGIWNVASDYFYIKSIK